MISAGNGALRMSPPTVRSTDVFVRRTAVSIVALGPPQIRPETSRERFLADNFVAVLLPSRVMIVIAQEAM